MRLLITTIAFFFVATTGFAQYSSKAALDSTHIMIGDHLRMHLDVTHPVGAQILPMVLKKEEGDVVEFLAQTKWDTVNVGNHVRLRKDLLLTAWDSGYYDVPPLPIVFLANAEKDTIYTQRIPIEVMVPAADSILADIKPIIEEPIEWTDYIPELALVLILLIAALMWYVASKIKTEQKAPPPPPVVIPPHEIALQQLKTLKGAQLWQKGEVKAYHSQLTYIIREYLEKRYGIQALEQTTDEILRQMKGLQLEQEILQRSKTVLETADLVKFAKAEPPATFHDTAMSFGEELIHVTKPTTSFSNTEDAADTEEDLSNELQNE